MLERDTFDDYSDDNDILDVFPEECYNSDGELDEKKIRKYIDSQKKIDKETKKITIDKDDNIIIEKTTERSIDIKGDSKKEIKTIDKKSDKEYVHNKESILVHLRLSKDNFIMKYIETMIQMTSSYPEYHFSMAISMLSIISDRKIRLSMRHKIIYPNVWLYLLGLSTVSQKSTAFDLGEEVLSKLSIEARKPKLIKNRLPGYFSPEGFGKALEECESQGHGYEWKDESGELLKTMEKEYMSNMRDFFCDLYGCKEFYRKLAKSEIFVSDPFVNMVLATTPDTFREYTQLTDLTSGWLYRFIYIYPRYYKDYMSIGRRTNKDNDKIKGLVSLLTKKVDFISMINRGNEIEFGFETGCLELYEKWSERMFYRAQKGKDEIEAAFIGRLEDYVLKLALIFTFGEPGFKTEISSKIMEMTCQLVENYFLPTAIDIADMVKASESDNKMDKVLGVIKRSGGKISRTRLIQNTHMKTKELDELCHTLEEGNEIKIYQESKITQYELVKEMK